LITVDELMSTQLYTLSESNTLHDARELMRRHKIRHVMVVDAEGLFVGLLTQRDLLKATVSALAEISNRERQELETNIPLRETMTRDVIVAESGANLIDAAKFLLETKHGCVPVVAQGYLKGIITEADFVKLAIKLMEKLAAHDAAHKPH